MNNSSIVIITGGSFQGKSIISLNCASSLNYSGVVTTDMIRNILKITNPHLEKIYSTSTYLLSKDILKRQNRNVSAIIKDLVKIYESRGEQIIFEGMHFDEDFFKWAKDNQFCVICLNNLLNLEERLILKSKTRSLFRFINSSLEKYEFNSINKNNVGKSAYVQYGSRIQEIHNTILGYCRKYNFNIVEYENINSAIKTTIMAIKKYNTPIKPTKKGARFFWNFTNF